MVTTHMVVMECFTGMELIDITVFIVYFTAMVGVGIYFFRKNKDVEDYYVGGRSMGSWHIGLSVVATDVGGGFSIGLGGLGFAIGLAGSWMLFTGLIGAWLSAVVLIPVISKLSDKHRFFTFPQIFQHFYNSRVAFAAGIISAIGYLGFTSSQLLAGAKLASATFPQIGLQTALIIMGVIAVVYTGIGGIKAVIYTDTIQWIILMSGLILIGIPIAFVKIGGMETIRATLSDGHLSMANVAWQDLVNWAVTIIPIWFVGMTLYQRIYASKGRRQAQRAWFIAGIFEWPLMAFMGVTLGLFSKVAFENGMFDALGHAAGQAFDAEMGLPVLLNTVLPAGLMGLMLSAYFSAILSTADSCLMAASGNVQTDILEKIIPQKKNHKTHLRTSQIITLLLGALALLLATSMTNVLDLMLYSYAFMVSGLFTPILAALYSKRPHSDSALAAMILGGTITVLLTSTGISLPWGLDANIFGISASAVTYILLYQLNNIGINIPALINIFVNQNGKKNKNG